MAPVENREGTKARSRNTSTAKGSNDFQKERRKYPRFYLKLPMSYSRGKDKENLGGIVGNASEGGMLVYLPEKLNTGELLKIEILFAKGWELKAVRGTARIVWSDSGVRKSRRICRYGLQFQFFNKSNLRRLKVLLREASH